MPVALGAGLLAAVLAGCYAFIGRYGPPFHDGDDPQYFERLVDRAVAQSTAPDSGFTAEVAGDERLRRVTGSAADSAACLAADPILRFAWLSDVQLRQREVKLFSDDISPVADNILPSFEHHPMLEEFDWAVYASVIAAINHAHLDYLADPEAGRGRGIDFAIHTGDAADAGTIEELYQFVYISDRLQVPWLSIVGNHDTGIFGNYRERMAYTRQSDVTFYPIGNTANFVYMHGPERHISGFGRHLLPVPATGGHAPSADGAGAVPPTNFHGFDLYPSAEQRLDPPSPERMPGDYRFDIGQVTDVDGGAYPIRVIALNSTKRTKFGHDSEITDEQLAWLDEAIATSEGRLLLVFSHHRPSEFGDRGKRVLNQAGRGPLVYFSGHSHKHRLKRVSSHGRYFYELNGGAVCRYPQYGRIIEIRQMKPDRVCLVSRALSNSYLHVPSSAPEHVAKVLDDCEKHRDARRASLRDAARCGHYGAFRDSQERRERPWGKQPQPNQEIEAASNVIIPL
ncbi:metallophosphoesterase family protein [Haliangium sp.]|uniref:metallophosphoesterase family protein n=1 Tax=Haliangium sp. TaxID=2663208 RepID=UPI003D0E54D2